MILHTADGGHNWNIQSSEIRSNLWSVAFAESRRGFIVGDSGTILYSIRSNTSVDETDENPYEPVEAAYPNPSVSHLCVRLRLVESAPVDVDVFDIRGREILTLADAVYPEGVHSIRFVLS